MSDITCPMTDPTPTYVAGSTFKRLEKWLLAVEKFDKFMTAIGEFYHVKRVGELRESAEVIIKLMKLADRIQPWLASTGEALSLGKDACYMYNDFFRFINEDLRNAMDALLKWAAKTKVPAEVQVAKNVEETLTDLGTCVMSHIQFDKMHWVQSCVKESTCWVNRYRGLIESNDP